MPEKQALWLREPQDVENALVHIRNHKIVANDPPSVSLMVELSRWARQVIRSGKKLQWANLWLEMGATAYHLLSHEYQYGWDEDKFKIMLCEKHKLYGLEALTSWGELGMAIRVDSKCDRLNNMVTFGHSDDNESIMDTIQDILGYAVLGIYMYEANRRLAEEAAKPKIITPDQIPADIKKLLNAQGKPLEGPNLRLTNN